MKKHITDIITQFRSIELNVWDKLVIIGFTILTTVLFYQGITALTLGGIILISGSFLTYKGQIFLSVGSYITADFCWIYNAWTQDDWKGMIFISIGIIFGIIATFKMGTGKMKKDLLK